MTWMSGWLPVSCVLLVTVGCQSLDLDDFLSFQESQPARTPSAPDAAQPAKLPPETLPAPPPQAVPPSAQPAGPLFSQPMPATPEMLRQQLDALTPQLPLVETDSSPGTLQISEVQASVNRQFPLVLAALQEAQIAAGKQQSARGAFDLKLAAETLNLPLGFYKNYRHRLKAEQPLLNGGLLYGQYRLGDGDFPVWYGERETNEGGEFKVGLTAPLLQGRTIDERRADIARADLQAAAVDPQVRQELIEAVNLASYMYWSWVAAGQTYLVTQELLKVAEDRNRGLARQVELGNLGATDLQQNERLVVSRQAKLVEAGRKLQAAALKLSLFLRDDNGDPRIPSARRMPTGFPEVIDPRLVDLDTEIQAALQRRPELAQLQVSRQIVAVDLQQAENELLPNLSAVVEASKDVGAPASSKGDKTPFELEAGLLFDVPLQRNKAQGKIQSAQGKLSQLSLKQQYTLNKIVVEVQDAHSARLAAYERIARARRNVELARQLVQAEYRAFELGNSDLLRIAIQEASELEARYLEIEALQDYFQATVQFSAATAQGW